MKVVADSISSALRPLISGPIRTGRAVGRGHLDFDGYVVSLTRSGDARMPNGIEVAVEASIGMLAAIGANRLELDEGRIVISKGPEWNPVPKVAIAATKPAPTNDLLDHAGKGPGLTPSGDDVLAGYIAGLVLFHRQHQEAADLASTARLLTNALSATLLLHASRGEVPEPVHSLLERSDPTALLAFGHTSGRAWLKGLKLAGALLPQHDPHVLSFFR